MAGRSSALLFQYRLLMAFIFPALALHAVWLALKHRHLRYLRERLGWSASMEPVDLWIHAASVGEVNAVLPLVNELRQRHPRRRLLLTTSTITGASVAATKLPDVRHCFLPLDRTGGVRRFLARATPRCALIMETELWPNLWAGCNETGIPLIVVNGRISPRTLTAPVWVRDLYEESLTEVAAVLARSEEDRQRFIALGAPRERVRVIGNIKFAAAPRADQAPLLLSGKRYVLAASTRDGEERLLAAAWTASGMTDHLLVIVPRHPQRLPAVLRDLNGYRIAVRSRGEQPQADTEIYLADTFGELTGLMAGAELVIMGGSLVPRGGQNLLEPAALGKAIMAGPHMDNFAAETALLREHEALIQVADAQELAARLAQLLADTAGRAALGANARRLVEERRDMAQRYADAIEPFCPQGDAA